MPPIQLVDVFLGFAHNSFEKRQAATCRFSKECTPSLQKSFLNSKASGVKWLRTY